MKHKLDNNKKFGLGATALFHIILLLLILIFGFRPPFPPPSEEGIMIDFGDSDKGFGYVEPTGNKVPQQKSSLSSSPDEELLTQSFEESVFIKEQKEKDTKPDKHKETHKVEQPEKEAEKQQVNQNALFPGAQNNVANQGESDGQGNQGSLDGTPNAGAYDGSGMGTKGSSWSLSGRSNRSLPKPNYTGNEQGRVVVEIFVDRAGRVIKANAGHKGSTTADQRLRDAAYNAAMSAIFDPKPDAPEVQRGTITYIFELQ